VTGIGVTLLATSASYYIYRLALPNVATPPRITPFSHWSWPWLQEIPFLGPILAQQTPLTYLALALFALVSFVLYRTPLALPFALPARTPAAVEAQGLDVHRIRMAVVVAGSALMAMGGAFLTMSAFNAFFFEMTGGGGGSALH
jgi:simple sugar transport system permease protein